MSKRSHIIDSKVYKRSFIIYSLAFFIALAVIYVFAAKSVLDGSLLHYEYKASKSFETTETTVASLQSRIDEFVTEMYSDRQMMDDFERFWNTDPSEYAARRIEAFSEGGKLVSFPDRLAEIIAGEDFIVESLYFIDDDNVCQMIISKSGDVDFVYNIDRSEYRRATESLSKKVYYTKNVKNPNNMTEYLGSISFFFDEEALADRLKDEFPNVTFSSAGYSRVNKEPVQKHFNIFRKTYNFEYRSARYNFSQIMTIDRKNVLENEAMTMLILTFAVIAAYIILVILIAEHMRQESGVLNKIITAIQSGRNGEFEHIEINGRRDEYAEIATEINQMADELKDYINREYVLTIKQQKTRMQALLYQINPHFLYNTLEIIRAGAVHNGDEETADEIVALAKMYRMLVKEEDIISIRRELELLKSYLKIMEYKYKDRFCYQIDVDEEVYELKTVKFWMQPVVENFFVHGIDEENEFNLLVIEGRAYEDRYVIAVTDNGKGIPDDEIEKINEKLTTCATDGEQKSIGIVNVAERLKSFYGSRCSLSLRKGEYQGLVVEMCLLK